MKQTSYDFENKFSESKKKYSELQGKSKLGFEISFSNVIVLNIFTLDSGRVFGQRQKNRYIVHQIITVMIARQHNTILL